MKAIADRSFASDTAGWTILVHGGAGRVAVEKRDAHSRGCLDAATAGADVLRGGGDALDAAQRAVEVLESDPLYNAGTGGSLNRDGALELDAAIMCGASMRVGAVCALPPFLHPVAVARSVLEDGRHAMYAGQGAARFAVGSGYEQQAADAMITAAARLRLEQALATGRAQSWAGGTVGAVVRHSTGSLAAATSTGGTVGKEPGRVGDSPLIGCGTYAEDAIGAVSATGDGEGILRCLLAYRCAALPETGDVPGRLAAELQRMHTRTESTGGVIRVGRHGFALARSTETMSWAAISPERDWRGV